jgi:hypothetical protein
MIIGTTGTREGLTNQQLAWLATTFETGKQDGTIAQVHHGACIGADAAVHAQALELEIPIHVWPPINQKYAAVGCFVPHPLVTVHRAMQYLDRDRQIVSAAYGLVALPKHNEQPERMLWGGTWYTVDFAERMGKPVIICYPNGVVEQRNPEQERR